MASEGPIDKLNIEVGVTPDLSGFDRAKTEAETKGEEIGKAVAEGMKRGADAVDDVFDPFAGKKGRPDTDSMKSVPSQAPANSGIGGGHVGGYGGFGTTSMFGPGIGQGTVGGAQVGPAGMGGMGGGGFNFPVAAGAGGAGGGAGGGAAFSAAVSALAGGALVASIDQLIGLLTRIEKLGETIGSGLFEYTKKQAELDNSIERLNTSVARQSALDEMRFQRVAGANVNIDPNMLADVSAKEAQAQSAEQQFIKHDAKASWWDRISQGLEKGSRFGPFGLLSYTGVLSHTSDLTQEEEQARELRGEADRARKPMTDILRRQRERGTMGGVVARVADEQGIEHGTLGTGVALDPASARVLEEALRNNAAMTAKLVEALSRSNQQNNDRAASLAIGRQVQTR